MKRAFWYLTFCLSVFILWGCGDTSNGTQTCTTNAECTDEAKPVCKAGTCVAEVEPECVTSNDCTDDAKPICQAGTCVAGNSGCSESTECTDPSKPICDNGECVAQVDEPECTTHADCTDEKKFMCKDQKCIDPSADFTPENYKIIVKSADETYTEAELEDLKQRVEYGFLKHVGNKDNEFSFGTNFNPSNESVLRVPVPNVNAGIKYTFKVDFRDSKFELSNKKKKFNAWNKEATKENLSNTYEDGTVVTLQSFAQTQPHEPRILVSGSINHTAHEELEAVYYAVMKKNTSDGAGYSSDPTKLGHYAFQDVEYGYLDIIRPQEGAGTKYFEKNGFTSHTLPAPKDNGVAYHFVIFKSKPFSNAEELVATAPNLPVVVKDFTSIYEESRFENYAKPIVASFTNPEVVTEPSVTATIEIPESMRNIENLHLQWANDVRPFLPNGDYSYYPSEEYLKRWGYYFSNIARGQKNVAGETSVTITSPSPKTDGKDTHIIFWFSEGPQTQHGAVGEEEQIHTRIAKQPYTSRYSAASIEALPPTFTDTILNYVTAKQFKKDSELFIKVDRVMPAGLPYNEFKRNTLTWTPPAPDGSTAATEDGERSVGGFMYATYPVMNSNPHGPDPEADWTGTPTLSGMPEYFHPQIDYNFTSTNELVNGSTASADRIYRANYKGCDAGTALKIPALDYFPDASPVNKEKKSIDLAWTNPVDIDTYEIRISWTETSPNPTVDPKHGEIIIQRFYNFNSQNGKLIYGEEPTGTIVPGTWSPQESFFEVTVY